MTIPPKYDILLLMKKKIIKTAKDVVVAGATIAGACVLLNGAYKMLPGENAIAKAQRTTIENTIASTEPEIASARLETKGLVTKTCFERGVNPIRPCIENSMEYYDTVTGAIYNGTGKLTKTDLKYGHSVGLRSAEEYARLNPED